ncbi:MAG: hypothetical protein ACRDHZ_12010, partial [Ktedonobacteraceae bacterium]
GALAFAFTVPFSYAYSTIIGIGSRVVGTQVQSIESSGSAASKLKNGYLPKVVEQYAKAHHINPNKFNFHVEAPPGADLVVISGKGTLTQADDYMAIEQAAAQMLIAADDRVTKSQQAQLQTQLAQAQAALDQLQDPQNQKLLKSQIDSLEAYKKQAQGQQITASHHAGNASNAMTLLLLGTQAQQSDQQLSTLQQQLNNLSSNIASQKSSVDSLKTQLNNLEVTRIVAGPMRSLKHVGMGWPTIIVIGAIMGVFLGLIASLSVNFVLAVRKRIMHEKV